MKFKRFYTKCIADYEDDLRFYVLILLFSKFSKPKKQETLTLDGAKAEDIKNEVRSKDESWSADHVQVEITRLLNNNEIMKHKRGFYKNIPF